MRPATVDELAGDPVGRYVSGEGFVHFCASPSLWGLLLWGRPTMDVARVLGRTLVLELAEPAVPHASLIDASRLEGADSGAFTALAWYMDNYGDELAKWVLRLALVRPSGLEGAIVSGVYDVLPRPYPVEVFDDAATALAWLAELDLEQPPVFADMPAKLDAVYAEASSTTPLVGRLRALLGAHLGGMVLADAASGLGVSERSLQRKLSDAGTTFQAEMGGARVRAAKHMLLDSDAALTRIALDVGCASLQHFSALFRRREGESPSAWRKRQKE